MKIYIDQSGKIEATNKATIIAFSNGEKRSVLVSAKDKKEGKTKTPVKGAFVRLGIFRILKQRMVTLVRHPAQAFTIATTLYQNKKICQ